MKKTLSALALVFAFIALPASAVTLLSGVTTAGASPSVHSTASGTPGGGDLWTISLVVTGPAASRRFQLQESLDGVRWTTVALFLGPTWSLTRQECGACHFRVFAAAMPAGSTISATATTTGSLSPAVE